MQTFTIKGEYIQLNQLLKILGWVEDGGSANAFIDEGLVLVNGVQEFRRRNKLTAGTTVEFNGQKVTLTAE